MTGMRQVTTRNVLTACAITLFLNWIATNLIFHSFQNSIHDAGATALIVFLLIGTAIGWRTFRLLDLAQVEPYFGAVVGAVIEVCVMLIF
jgi:hypothetical protein